MTSCTSSQLLGFFFSCWLQIHFMTSLYASCPHRLVTLCDAGTAPGHQPCHRALPLSSFLHWRRDPDSLWRSVALFRLTEVPPSSCSSPCSSPSAAPAAPAAAKVSFCFFHLLAARCTSVRAACLLGGWSSCSGCSGSSGGLRLGVANFWARALATPLH